MIRLWSEIVYLSDGAMCVGQLEGDKLPVMVWIHGGGFTFGSGNADFHDPEYWMEQGVVLVTCNYRVGALGTFTCRTSSKGQTKNKQVVIVEKTKKCPFLKQKIP